MAERDPWDLSTGLPDDFDFTVDSAHFGLTGEGSEDKRTKLILRGPALDEDGDPIDEAEDGEAELQYSLGDGWEALKGGAAVKHGVNKNFNNRSSIGHLITSLVDNGALDVLRERGLPTQASTWQGLKFHVKRTETARFTPKGETEEIVVNTPLCTEFYGVEGEGTAKKTSAKTSAKKTPAKRRPRKKALRTEVIEFAAEYEDHSEFAADVLDPEIFTRADEVEADEELQAEVLDADSELWEEAQSGE